MFHEEAVQRLQAAHKKLQARLEAMYEDKLDGKVVGGCFERKSAEWRAEQESLLRQIGRASGREPELHRRGRAASGPGAPRP